MKARPEAVNRKSFTTAFTVDQSPHIAYAAINNVGAWWTGDNEGSADTLDGVFTHRFEDMHRCRIRVVELEPNRKVAWLVLDNYFEFTQDKTEWQGTKMIFDIVDQGGNTEIRFTHEGLVPAYECFDLCSNAWNSLMNDNLRSLIATIGNVNRQANRKGP